MMILLESKNDVYKYALVITVSHFAMDWNVVKNTTLQIETISKTTGVQEDNY